METWTTFLIVLGLAFCDIFVSLFSLGFYLPSFQFDIDLIWKFISMGGKYGLQKSAIEFVLLALLRVGVLVGGLFIRFSPCDKSVARKLILPLLGFFIVHWTVSMIKLLAFSEQVEQLGYLGVWLSLVWNVLSSVILLIVWYFVICSNTSLPYEMLVEDIPEQLPPNGLGPGQPRRSPSFTEALKKRRGAFQHALGLLVYCKNQWKWFTSGFIFLILYSLARVFIPYYTGQVIASIVRGRSIDTLIRCVLYMSGLTLISTFFGGLRGGCLDYATALVNRQMRCDLFRSLVSQEIAFFDTTKTGEITSRLTADCQTMSSTVSVNVNVFMRNGVMLLGALVFMFALSWRLATITFIAVPLVGFITKLYGSYYDRLSERTQATIAAANEVAEEVLSTMRTVRSFACEKREAARFESHLDNTLSLCKRKAIAYTGYSWTNEFCDNAILVAVLFYGGHLVLSGMMTADNLISFLLYQMQLGENLYNIGYVFTGLMESVGASRKVFEYMKRQPTVKNLGTVKSPVVGEVKFSDKVAFSYPSRPANIVLQDVNFIVQEGQTVAFVGPSGGGKSSIVALIEHFYECNSGLVLIDDVPVQDYDHDYIHEKVALVAQEPVLYEGTIRSNILYGCDWATEEDMLRAAKVANVHNFVMETEHGYDTNCGEKGVQLSGGQKQRIAIARALVRRPAVLILDEATSALDAESEHLVQEALSRCAHQMTMIVIAHRLSTVERADCIFVVDKGRIVQCGRHEELVRHPGLYHTLVQRQLLGQNGDNESNA